MCTTLAVTLVCVRRAKKDFSKKMGPYSSKIASLVQSRASQAKCRASPRDSNLP